MNIDIKIYDSMIFLQIFIGTNLHILIEFYFLSTFLFNFFQLFFSPISIIKN